MTKSENLSRNILIALVLGSLVGTFLPAAAPYVQWMGLTFKLSLQMIVMPIVLTSILCGLESIGDIRKLKRLGKRALFYYVATTLFAISVGLLLVTSIKPGLRPPSLEISEVIYHVDEPSIEEAALVIAHELKTQFNASERKNLAKNIDQNLERLVRSSKDMAELKNGAIELAGSLELRSRLLLNSDEEVAQSPSARRFFEDQLSNALKNPFEALANQHVLAVIVFTLLFGTAMTTIGEQSKNFFQINRAVNMATIKIVGLIMRFAPFGVFGLLVSVVSKTGPEVFRELSLYALTVVIGLSIHLFMFLPAINFLYTKQSPLDFLRKLRPLLLVAFSTSSSNASLPVAMKTMEENFKVDKRVSNFVLPLGATINMDGTALYEAVAAVFIAQLYGVSLGLSGQVMIAITAALAAIGTAGIPAAGTVTMALILSAVGLPLEGVGLLLALDRPLDMCRTAVNVAGDATGCNILNGMLSSKSQG